MRCPKGYYFDTIEGECKPLKGNGKFNVDTYLTFDKRSYYDPISKEIALGEDRFNRVDVIPHEKEHAIQDKNGEMSTFNYAPRNKVIFGINNNVGLYNRRSFEIDKIVEDFEGYWKKAYPNRLYPKEFNKLSPEIKRFKADQMIYLIPGTIEYEAQKNAEKKMVQDNPDDEDVQLNYRQMGGMLPKAQMGKIIPPKSGTNSPAYNPGKIYGENKYAIGQPFKATPKYYDINKNAFETEQEAQASTANIIAQGQGNGPQIRQAPEGQSTASKAWEVAKHPLTAAKTAFNGGAKNLRRLPDNFSQGETNPFDLVTGFPGQVAQSVYNTGKNILDPLQTSDDLAKGTVNAFSNFYTGKNVFNDGSNERALSIAGDALFAIPAVKGLVKGNLKHLGTHEEFSDLITTIKNKIKTQPNVILTEAEKQLLHNTRTIGSLVQSNPLNDLKVLQAIEKQAANISDDAFEKLTGFPKSEIKVKIDELKVKGSKKEEVASYNSGYNDDEIYRMRQQQYLGNTRYDNIIDEIDNMSLLQNRSGAMQQMRERFGSSRQESEGLLDNIQLNPSFISDAGSINLQRPTFRERIYSDDPYHLSNQLAALPNELFINNANQSFIKPQKESLLKRLNLRVSNQLVESPLGNPKSLLPSLSKSAYNNPAKEILKAYNKVKAATKGEEFIPASSLSSDSYPISLNLINKAVKDNIGNVSFHGFKPMNYMGFSQKAGLNKKVNLSEINKLLQNINKNLSKKIPLAKIYGEDILYPDLKITRKKFGGSIPINPEGLYEENNEVIIPSNNISMIQKKGKRQLPNKVWAFPDGDAPVLMNKGNNYFFPNSKNVLEVPQNNIVHAPELGGYFKKK